MDHFDFDEWAELYRRDPEGFEARRHAMLAIELAKAGPQAAAARDALRRLEAELQGKGDFERIETSLAWMATSMKALAGQMDQLGESLSALRAATPGP